MASHGASGLICIHAQTAPMYSPTLAHREAAAGPAAEAPACEAGRLAGLTLKGPSVQVLAAFTPPLALQVQSEADNPFETASSELKRAQEGQIPLKMDKAQLELEVQRKEVSWECNC